MAASLSLTENEFPNCFKKLNELFELKKTQLQKDNPDKKISFREVVVDLLSNSSQSEIEGLRIQIETQQELNSNN